MKMRAASNQIGIKVMMDLFQSVLDCKVMPDEWKTSVIASIFKEKGDVTSCIS